MNANQPESRPVRRRRPGIFWPLTLIALGVVFLLNNLGLIQGDLWDTILKLWPLIFIFMGLDGIVRREGMVGTTLVIGLGVVFLLGNFGYLPLPAWEVLFRLWPLFLVALGFDILVGRRSKLLSLLGMILILAILGGSLWAMATGLSSAAALEGTSIRQDLEGIEQARIIIEPGAGYLRLHKLQEPVALVMGTVPSAETASVTQQFSLEGGQATYVLSASGSAYSFPSSSSNVYRWDLGLATGIPIDLEVNLGAGEADLNLKDLEISALEYAMSLGQVTLNLPPDGDFSGRVEGAIGQLIILVPEGLGLRAEADTALVTIQTPQGYRKEGSTYISPNYGSADYRIDLRLDLAIGRVVIREQ